MKCKTVALFGVLGLMGGCGTKDCFNYIYNVAAVHNLTAQTRTLEVCNNYSRYGVIKQYKTQLDIASSEMKSFKVAGDWEHESEKQFDLDKKGGDCKGPDSRESRAVQVSLTENSFSQVKLCNGTLAQAQLIVELNENCPSGYQAQESAVTCIVEKN